MCIKHLLHAPDIGGGPGPGHCAGNLTYMMQVNLLKSLGIGYLMFIFLQEDLNAGRATMGVKFPSFFFIISHLESNVGCDGTYRESRLGVRKKHG